MYPVSEPFFKEILYHVRVDMHSPWRSFATQLSKITVVPKLALHLLSPVAAPAQPQQPGLVVLKAVAISWWPCGQQQSLGHLVDTAALSQQSQPVLSRRSDSWSTCGCSTSLVSFRWMNCCNVLPSRLAPVRLQSKAKVAIAFLTYQQQTSALI